MNNTIKKATQKQAIIISIIMILCTISTLVLYEFMTKDYIKVEATVIDKDFVYSGRTKSSTAHVYYEYNINGNAIIGHIPTYTPFYELGSKKIIYVNPNNPEKIANKIVQPSLIFISVLMSLPIIINVKIIKKQRYQNIKRY